MDARFRCALSGTLLAATLFTLPAIRAEAAPVGFQASGGWYTEEEVFHLDAGVRFTMGSIAVIPNGEWLFADSGHVYTLNVDGTMSFVPLGVANIYGGVGIGWLTVKPDGFDSNMDTVVNLIGGVGFNTLPMRPFGQLKWVIVEGNDPLVLSLGIQF